MFMFPSVPDCLLTILHRPEVPATLVVPEIPPPVTSVTQFGFVSPRLVRDARKATRTLISALAITAKLISRAGDKYF